MESHNLCNLPDSERQAIEADKTACLWLWRLKRGEINRQDIHKLLAQLGPDMRELVRAKLNDRR